MTPTTTTNGNGIANSPVLAQLAEKLATADTVKPTADPNASLLAELARLKAENERLRTAKTLSHKLYAKVSEKGAVSVYGNGRFPTTLYREQWERLIAFVPELKTFIEANRSVLAVKGEN